MKRKTVFILGGVVVFVVAAGLVGRMLTPQPLSDPTAGMSSKAALSTGSTESRLGLTAPGAPAPMPAKALDVAGGGEDEAALAQPLVPEAQGTKVVNTAELEIEIEDDSFQTQFARAGDIAKQFGGFVAHSSTSQTDGQISSGTIVIRVPADKFQDALRELKGLGEVNAESQSGTDVTQEFIDLEARLRHLRAQETFYLSLINEAESISDMIQIQERLSGVQSQIEQIQGRLQYLEDQTSFSTITSRIFEPEAAISQPKGFAKAFAESWAAFKNVAANMIVGAGWLMPFVILGGLVVGLWKVLRRRPAVAPAE